MIVSNVTLVLISINPVSNQSANAERVITPLLPIQFTAKNVTHHVKIVKAHQHARHVQQTRLQMARSVPAKMVSTIAVLMERLSVRNVTPTVRSAPELEFVQNVLINSHSLADNVLLVTKLVRHVVVQDQMTAYHVSGQQVSPTSMVVNNVNALLEHTAAQQMLPNVNHAILHVSVVPVQKQINVPDVMKQRSSRTEAVNAKNNNSLSRLSQQHVVNAIHRANHVKETRLRNVSLVSLEESS